MSVMKILTSGAVARTVVTFLRYSKQMEKNQCFVFHTVSIYLTGMLAMVVFHIS